MEVQKNAWLSPDLLAVLATERVVGIVLSLAPLFEMKT